jgi:hypothetical protein
MNDERTRNQEQPSAQREGSEPLTTKDMAGAAVQRAPVEQRPMEQQPQQNVRGEQQANAPLFEQNETEEFRARWNNIQVQFVDEPRRSVEQADELVAQTMKRLAEVFARERDRLEQEWDRGDNVSTEDLRIALQRYRSFFDRLLSV